MGNIGRELVWGTYGIAKRRANCGQEANMVRKILYKYHKIFQKFLETMSFYFSGYLHYDIINVLHCMAPNGKIIREN
jgi:hypothetical protein